ncbi:YEATS domain-containing protein 2-like [Salarias fasciatus]|uniref:YEATS domain-containing protein 2-like n=1 Tax=Salarias fasciatus TaxID=181472 RepID=UPI00117703D4|nr:YEATS domain-containing protein 2-like [Salarias fasciatus]
MKRACQTAAVPSFSPRPKPRGPAWSTKRCRRPTRTWPSGAAMWSWRDLPEGTAAPGAAGAAGLGETPSLQLQLMEEQQGGQGGQGGRGGRGGQGGQGGAAPEELSGPQAISLHITLRAGLTEQSLKPEDLQPTSEHEPRKLPGSPGSVDEETELRGLAERMGQLSVSGAAGGSSRRRSPPPGGRRGEEEAEEEEKSYVVL